MSKQVTSKTTTKTTRTKATPKQKEVVVEEPVLVETPVVEENASPFVSAGSKFLTRTSARLVYGDKNDQE